MKITESNIKKLDFTLKKATMKIYFNLNGTFMFKKCV